MKFIVGYAFIYPMCNLERGKVDFECHGKIGDTKDAILYLLSFSIFDFDISYVLYL